MTLRHICLIMFPIRKNANENWRFFVFENYFFFVPHPHPGILAPLLSVFSQHSLNKLGKKTCQERWILI